MAKKYILKRVSLDEPIVDKPRTDVQFKIDYKNILNPAQYEAVITIGAGFSNSWCWDR